MQQCIQEESRELLRNREELLAFVKNDKEKLEHDFIIKSGITEEQLTQHNKVQEEYDANVAEIRTRYNKILDDLASELYSGKITYENYSEKAKSIKDEKLKEQLNYATKNSDKMLQLNEMNTKIFDAKTKAHNEYSKKYSDLSDMVDAATKGKFSLNAGSHGQRYWRSDAQNQAVEFFAEVYSAKATKNQESYDLIKKYFPKSVEIFEEILRG